MAGENMQHSQLTVPRGCTHDDCIQINYNVKQAITHVIYKAHVS